MSSPGSVQFGLPCQIVKLCSEEYCASLEMVSLYQVCMLKMVFLYWKDGVLCIGAAVGCGSCYGSRVWDGDA